MCIRDSCRLFFPALTPFAAVQCAARLLHPSIITAARERPTKKLTRGPGINCHSRSAASVLRPCKELPSDAAAACRKSLQADPSKADAWFILGSVLFGEATIDANGKIAISAEARHALDKYFELAPEGPHAPDVKQMLDSAAK